MSFKSKTFGFYTILLKKIFTALIILSQVHFNYLQHQPPSWISHQIILSSLPGLVFEKMAKCKKVLYFLNNLSGNGVARRFDEKIALYKALACEWWIISDNISIIESNFENYSNL